MSTRGLASDQFDLAQEHNEHKGLEWFGPPERNTLRPLCVVLLVLRELESVSSFSVLASASLLYLKGGAYMTIESPTGGPNNAV